MCIGSAIGLVGRLVGGGVRPPSAPAVRYSPECARCGVPDEEAHRFPDGVSVCRACRAHEIERV